MTNLPNIKIIETLTNREQLRSLTHPDFGGMVKAVVDLDRKIMAVGGELHADEEAVLLENGSQQQNLWGINLYLDKELLDMVEFDSMINIRPSQNNRSRGVENETVRQQIIDTVKILIK